MMIMLLFACMLMIMLMRVVVPIGAKIDGKPVSEIKLDFHERLLLQRFNIYAIGAVLLLATLTGVLPGIWEIIVVLAACATLMIPARYVITSRGIALNNVTYYPWSDFTAFGVKRRSISLLPQAGRRKVELRVLNKHREEILTCVRSYLTERSADRPAAAA
jgi:hypothetical protein